MSFNFIPLTTDDNTSEENLPVFFEVARDMNNLNLLVKNGKFYLVSKNEAIKIWILKVLNIQTARYEHRAYSSDYGNELSKLFGRYLKNTLLKSEIERCIKEALLVNPYIKKLYNFTFQKTGSTVDVEFTVSTVYGEFEQNLVYKKE